VTTEHVFALLREGEPEIGAFTMNAVAREEATKMVKTTRSKIFISHRFVVAGCSKMKDRSVEGVHSIN
jgi:hypothetical protein